MAAIRHAHSIQYSIHVKHPNKQWHFFVCLWAIAISNVSRKKLFRDEGVSFSEIIHFINEQISKCEMHKGVIDIPTGGKHTCILLLRIMLYFCQASRNPKSWKKTTAHNKQQCYTYWIQCAHENKIQGKIKREQNKITIAQSQHQSMSHRNARLFKHDNSGSPQTKYFTNITETNEREKPDINQQ